MITRFFFPFAVAGLLLGGCSQHGTMAARTDAAKVRDNRYELASRNADPLANYGEGTSAGIPANPALGRYPGPLVPPVTPFLAIED